MSGQQQPTGAATGQDDRTPEQIDEELQEAARREAATREELPDAAQFSDSGNRDGMGVQGAGHGRRSGQHS